MTSIIDMMRTESIAATLPGGAITRDSVVAVNDARRAAAGALQAMTVPDDVRPEHLALSAALDDLATAVDDFLMVTTDLEEGAFGVAVGEAFDLQTLATRVGSTCAALNGRFADLGIEAEVRC